jgi:hypothetical protein
MHAIAECREKNEEGERGRGEKWDAPGKCAREG